MYAHLNYLERTIARQMPPCQFGIHATLNSTDSQDLMIGDVGLLDPTNGCFEFFFNITFPKGHPYHLISVSVPSSFQPFALNLSEDTEHVVLPNDPIIRGNFICTADELFRAIQSTL